MRLTFSEVRLCLGAVPDNNLPKLRTLNGRERVRNITLNVFDLLNGCLDSAIWPAVEQALGDALATADVDLILNEIARAICRRAHESGNIKLVDGEWRFVQG